MAKKLYVVLYENPRYDEIDYKIFADKGKAKKKFNEWKKYIKENYLACEEDSETIDLFRRFDYNYGYSMPFVSIDEIAYTNDNKKIIVED